MNTVISNSPILLPVITLVLWTCFVWLWMYATRIPSIAKLGLKMDNTVPPGELMNKLPPNVRWKADNYNHLHEQPTLFYAVAIMLAILGAGSGVNLTLAWVYVGIRITHSLIQILWNKIEVRFSVFVCASIVLMALAIRTAMVICG